VVLALIILVVLLNLQAGGQDLKSSLDGARICLPAVGRCGVVDFDSGVNLFRLHEGRPPGSRTE
jgi:hypothetical protein